MSAFRLASSNPRLVAQLAWVFERDAAELARESRRFETGETSAMTPSATDAHLDRIRETRRLRGIACDLEAAAMHAGYFGYPFGEEA